MIGRAPLPKSPNWASHSTSTLRPCHRIAILETERSEFRQHRVVHVKPALIRRTGFAAVRSPHQSPGPRSRSGAVQRCRAGEVSSREPHSRAAEQQRSERNGLSHRPIDCLVFDHAGPPLQLRFEPTVHSQVLRQDDLTIGNLLQHGRRDCCGHPRRELWLLTHHYFRGHLRRRCLHRRRYLSRVRNVFPRSRRTPLV